MALQRFGGLQIFSFLIITFVVPSGAAEYNVLEMGKLVFYNCS